VTFYTENWHLHTGNLTFYTETWCYHTSSILRNGDHYLVNGHKWYISGSMRPECKVFIFLGRTATEGPRHGQQTMLIIPKDTPGVRMIRALEVFGHVGDHAEIIFDNVKVRRAGGGGRR
jgi:alkylation response protein AidB-like acyl-CoA dehydrogenase